MCNLEDDFVLDYYDYYELLIIKFTYEGIRVFFVCLLVFV